MYRPCSLGRLTVRFSHREVGMRITPEGKYSISMKASYRNGKCLALACAPCSLFQSRPHRVRICLKPCTSATTFRSRERPGSDAFVAADATVDGAPPAKLSIQLKIV